MSANTPNPSMREKVLERIARNNVHMRPRWYFVLSAGLGVAGVTLVTLALVYLVSFVLFALRESGLIYIPFFGTVGLRVFLLWLPWKLLAIGLVFIVLLELLVSRYAVAYRRPLLYSVLAILALTSLGALAVALTPLHTSLYRYSLGHHIPIAEPLYRNFGLQPERSVYPGIIRQLNTHGFELEMRGGELLIVTVDGGTALPPHMTFGVGDTVVIFGKRDDDTVRAQGIRPLGGRQLLRPPRSACLDQLWRGSSQAEIPHELGCSM